jgi:hypothetical protein
LELSMHNGSLIIASCPSVKAHGGHVDDVIFLSTLGLIIYLST